MEDDAMQELQSLRAEVEGLRAKAERYDGAGLGDVLARLDSMEQRLAPPPTKEEQRIQQRMARGMTREEAERSVKSIDRFFADKKRRENNWENPLKQ